MTYSVTELSRMLCQSSANIAVARWRIGRPGRSDELIKNDNTTSDIYATEHTIEEIETRGKTQSVGGAICYTIKVSTYNEDKFIPSSMMLARGRGALFSVGLFRLSFSRGPRRRFREDYSSQGTSDLFEVAFRNNHLRLTELLDSWAGVGRRGLGPARYSPSQPATRRPEPELQGRFVIVPPVFN